jgi:hypothetical protein
MNKILNFRADGFKFTSGFVCHKMGRAVDVSVELVVQPFFDHQYLRWFLRRGRIVEINQWSVVNFLAKNGKTASYFMDIVVHLFC